MRKSGTTSVVKKQLMPVTILLPAVFITLFMFIAPFYKGLFNGLDVTFEGAIFTAAVWTSLFGIIAAMGLYKQFPVNTHRGFLSIIIWFIPIASMLSLFQAASLHYALNEIYIRFMWVAFFLIGIYVPSNPIGNKIIKCALVGAGYVLVIFGMLNWFGNSNYKDALLVGHQLSSVFQYPNTYAAYIFAILIASLILIQNANRWYSRVIPAFMLLPAVLSIQLTQSTGALIIAGIVLLLYLVFLAWYRQIVTLLYLIIVSASSFFLHNTMMSIRVQLDAGFSSVTSVKGWAILIGVSLLVVVVVELTEKYVYIPMQTKWEKTTGGFRWSSWVIPIIGLLLAISVYLFVGNLNTMSVTSRSMFIKDSFKIIRDYPLFGSGGGAWSVLYDSYKDYPYTSAQAHNFILQYMVETGVVGLIFLLGVILYVLYLFVRNFIQSNGNNDWDSSRLIYPIIGLTILVHSLLDFDMSYVYLSCIVFLTLGASVAFSDSTIQLFGKSRVKYWRNACLAGTSILFGLFFVFSFMAERADANYKRAMDKAVQTGSYEEIKKPLDKAIQLSFGHPQYVLFKVNILNQLYEQYNDKLFREEAYQLIDQLERKEPNNVPKTLAKFQMLIQDQKFDDAYTLISSTINKFPWQITLYDMAIATFAQLGMQSDNLTDENNHFWDKSLILLERLMQQQSIISSEPIAVQKMQLAPSTILQIAKIYYFKDEFSKASDLLNKIPIGDINNHENRERLRWYLALLRIQGKWDENLYQQLLAVDRAEENEIDQIVNYKTKP
jgi:tetratricopeptide (TPR) repeat protein